jgi:hypothetical protein
MPVTETTEMEMPVIQETQMPVIQAPRGGPGSEPFSA